LYFCSSHITKSLESSFHETPPHILRERIRYCQNEYDELREFTVLEKQIYNAGCYEEVCNITIHMDIFVRNKMILLGVAGTFSHLETLN
jgi:hypothetical protein